MNDVEHALSELAHIRARVTASSRFRGFAPEAMTFGSALALLVAMAQTLWPDTLASSAPRFVAVWAAAFACCAAVSTVEAVARSRALHGNMADAMLGSTLRQLLPFVAAGAAIAVVMVAAAPDEAWIVPGLWQILVGLAGFTAAPSLPRAIIWPSAWFLASGVAVLAIAAGAETLSPWLVGGPYAVGQAAVALVLSRANGDRHGHV